MRSNPGEIVNVPRVVELEDLGPTANFLNFDFAWNRMDAHVETVHNPEHPPKDRRSTAESRLHGRLCQQ